MKLFYLRLPEPRKDGVGDYTRRLAGNAFGRDIVRVFALHDKDCSAILRESQYAEGQIDTLRFSKQLSWKERVAQAKRFVDTYEPDWLSLHPSSTPSTPRASHSLNKAIEKIGGSRNWHIMFHELWLGLTADAKLNINLLETYRNSLFAIWRTHCLRR